MPIMNRRNLLARGLGAATGTLAASAAMAGQAADAVVRTAAPVRTHTGGGMFGIRVIDSKTKRGVPLVELRTVNNIRYITDSAGMAAVGDSGLLRRRSDFFAQGVAGAQPGCVRSGRVGAIGGLPSAVLHANRRSAARSGESVTIAQGFGDHIAMCRPSPDRR